METLTKWPTNKPAELHSFFGKFQLGDDGRPTTGWETTFLTQISTPFRVRLAWCPDVSINRITCHREVTSSLHRILGEILNHFGSPEEVKKAGYDLLGGAYQFRTACGSHKLSMHAYGAAIQLGPLRHPKHERTDADEAVDKIFSDEGWSWLGAAEGWGAIDL